MSGFTPSRMALKNGQFEKQEMPGVGEEVEKLGPSLPTAGGMLDGAATTEDSMAFSGKVRQSHHTTQQCGWL